MRNRSLALWAGLLLTAALAVVVVDVSSILSDWPGLFTRSDGGAPAEPRACDLAPDPPSRPAAPLRGGEPAAPADETLVARDLESALEGVADPEPETADAEGPDPAADPRSKLSPSLARLLDDGRMSPETPVRVILQAYVLWRNKSRVAKSVISHVESKMFFAGVLSTGDLLFESALSPLWSGRMVDPESQGGLEPVMHGDRSTRFDIAPPGSAVYPKPDPPR